LGGNPFSSVFGYAGEGDRKDKVSTTLRSLYRRQRRMHAALEIARRYGGVDGDHHKAWVIDQMVRALTRDRYDSFVRKATAGGYDWYQGIAP
jgi:hypothetical protein